MNKKKYFLYGLSILMSPIIIGVFLLDRILLALFPWVRIQTIRSWAVNDTEISYSFVRVIACSLIMILINYVL